MLVMMAMSIVPAFAVGRRGGGGGSTIDVPAGPHEGTHDVLGGGGHSIFGSGGHGVGVGGSSF